MGSYLQRRLSRHVEPQKIERAIEAAERGSTGRINVSVAPHFWGDVRRAAETAFSRRRLHQTPDRNAVYFFVVPSRRQFAVLGDAGIHHRVGEEYWQRLAASFAEHARTQGISEALVDAIADVGKRLSEHFPRTPERQ